MDPSEWRCTCVEDKEGYNGLMCRDLSNVMHRDSTVEGEWKVEPQNMRRVTNERYISEPMGELLFGEEICWA